MHPPTASRISAISLPSITVYHQLRLAVYEYILLRGRYNEGSNGKFYLRNCLYLRIHRDYELLQSLDRRSPRHKLGKFLYYASLSPASLDCSNQNRSQRQFELTHLAISGLTCSVSSVEQKGQAGVSSTVKNFGLSVIQNHQRLRYLNYQH